MPPGLKNHIVLRKFVFIDDYGLIHSPFEWPLRVFVVGRDRERGRNAKCVTIKDKTWLHVYDHAWQYHLSSCWCNLKLHISSFFLVRARTNMDPNKWVIFALNSVPAHRSSAIAPCPKRTKLMLPNPPPSRHSGTGIKAMTESNNQGHPTRI